MSINVSWGNEAQTLLVMRVHEPYTADEFVDGVEAINALMGMVDHRVCPAVDFSTARTLPMGALANYRRIASKMGHPNSTGGLIVIGAHRTVQSLLEIFSKVFRKIDYAETLEEARALGGEGNSSRPGED
jgi:hypothetical protein